MPRNDIKIALWIVFFVAYAKAAMVTFRVIAPGAQDVKVSVGGQTLPLTASDPDVPYFQGTAEASENAVYKYIADGRTETFDRTLPAGRTSTRNDFLDRPVTYANIPELPWPIKDNPQWTRGGAESPMFDTNYIPSIFITGDAAELDTLVRTVPATLYTVKFTFIGPDEVLSYQNCSFGIHGAGKKHNNAKQSWRWHLPPGQTIYNRDYIKLRHMEEDPTQLREKLYADTLQALGTYAGQANMVRLFINGRGFGTFNMLDDIPQYSYIRAMFYNGKPPQQLGPLYDGASGADFLYHPNPDGYSSWIPNLNSPKDQMALDPLCKTFNETDVQDDSQLRAFDQMFAIDQFLRFMVMEYLTGHWDGYWMAQTNCGAYSDPTENNRWYYLGQDFDGTYGVNLAEPEGQQFVSVSYKEFPNRYPGAVMINRLLENPSIAAKFETYLKDTVAILFNNYTLTNRVLAYHDFVYPDLVWDRSIKQLSPGIDFGWVLPQVTENLWRGVLAPNANGGGASWGLVEWIVAKSEAMAKEFNIQITTHPVAPPVANQTTSANATIVNNNTPIAQNGSTVVSLAGKQHAIVPYGVILMTVLYNLPILFP